VVVGRARDPGAAPTGRGQRIAAISIGVLGVVAAGVGTYAGLHAKSLYDEAYADCNHSTMCVAGSPGLATRADASTWAGVSTATFIGAGVALAAGVVFFVTAPRHEATTAVRVTPAPQGLSVSLVRDF
jgi:hypothetical protein